MYNIVLITQHVTVWAQSGKLFYRVMLFICKTDAEPYQTLFNEVKLNFRFLAVVSLKICQAYTIEDVRVEKSKENIDWEKEECKGSWEERKRQRPTSTDKAKTKTAMQRNGNIRCHIICLHHNRKIIVNEISWISIRQRRRRRRR